MAKSFSAAVERYYALLPRDENGHVTSDVWLPVTFPAGKVGHMKITSRWKLLVAMPSAQNIRDEAGQLLDRRIGYAIYRVNTKGEMVHEAFVEHLR